MSPFFDFYCQFFTEYCSKIWLKHNQMFLENIYSVTINIVSDYFSPLSRFAYNTFVKLKGIYLFWLKKDQLA